MYLFRKIQGGKYVILIYGMWYTYIYISCPSKTVNLFLLAVCFNLHFPH